MCVFVTGGGEHPTSRVIGVHDVPVVRSCFWLVVFIWLIVSLRLVKETGETLCGVKMPEVVVVGGDDDLLLTERSCF